MMLVPQTFNEYATAPPLLAARGVTRRFGGLLPSTTSASMSGRVRSSGSSVRNGGAGKTTLFSLLSGFQKLDAGEVLFDQRRFPACLSSPRRGAGFGAQLQTVQVFPDMTVLSPSRHGSAQELMRAPSARRGGAGSSGAHQQADVVPTSLSIQDKKLLEIAKRCATEPRLIPARRGDGRYDARRGGGAASAPSVEDRATAA